MLNCAIYHPLIKPATNHFAGCEKLAKSCCRKQREVLHFATKAVHVARFTGPKKTCFELVAQIPCIA